MSDPIEITFPSVEVARALAIAPRVTAGFEKLWTSGWLRSLMALPEGEVVLRAFEETHRAAIDQLLTASRDEERSVTITIDTRPAHAQALVVFARRLYDLLADEQTMHSVGGVPLSSEDRRFVEPLLDQAERTVAARV